MVMRRAPMKRVAVTRKAPMRAKVKPAPMRAKVKPAPKVVRVRPKAMVLVAQVMKKKKTTVMKADPSSLEDLGGTIVQDVPPSGNAPTAASPVKSASPMKAKPLESVAVPARFQAAALRSGFRTATAEKMTPP